jgi:perosamine synthetase
MRAILNETRDRGIALIEDAAEAVGSQQNGRRAGSFGDTGVFSFHGSKTLTTGEGGMLVTDDPRVYERAVALRDHGRAPSDKMFWNLEIGFKYKMSSMQAALGLAQLERIDELVERKREIFSWYEQRLGTVSGLTLSCEQEGTLNSYWMVTLIVDPSFGWTKEPLILHLGEAGIDTRPFFYPLSSLPPFQSVEGGADPSARNPVSYGLSPYGLNLPSALNATEDEVAYVCETLLSLLEKPPEERGAD